MMKSKLLKNLAIPLFGVIALTPNTIYARQESVKEYASDISITSAIKGKMLTDYKIKLFQITVETYAGIVLLSGVVDTRAQATRAVEIARNVDGVKEVRTNLLIKEDL